MAAEEFYPAGDTAQLRITGDGTRQDISFHPLSSESTFRLVSIAHQLALALQSSTEGIRVLGEVADPICHFLKLVDRDRDPFEDWCAIEF